MMTVQDRNRLARLRRRAKKLEMRVELEGAVFLVEGRYSRRHQCATLDEVEGRIDGIDANRLWVESIRCLSELMVLARKNPDAVLGEPDDLGNGRSPLSYVGGFLACSFGIAERLGASTIDIAGALHELENYHLDEAVSYERGGS